MKLSEEIHLAQSVVSEVVDCDTTPCSMSDRMAKTEAAIALIPKIAEYLEDLNTRISKMEGTLDDTKEIVSAWGNIRGFGRTLAFVSNLLKVSAPIVLFFGFIYLLFYNPQLAFEKARLWMGTK